MNDSVVEFREMESDTLRLHISQREQDLLELKEGVRTGKEKNHAKLRVVKSEIARAKTVLNEK